MPMSEERTRELTALEPPPSIERIVRFFTELGERINTAGVTDGQGGPGDAGRKAAAFAKGVAAGSSDTGETLAHWFTALMDRYQVRVVDLPEFSLWLAKWYDIRSRTDSVVIHDDASAPQWGQSAGRVARHAAAPAVQAGAALASPARPAPSASVRRASSRNDGASDRLSDGPEPRGSDAAGQRQQFTDAPRSTASGPGPASLDAAPPDAPAPRGGMSSVAKRRLWTTNLAMGGMLSGSLMQSAQAAASDPNAVIVGGGPMGAPPPSSVGITGPHPFASPALNAPFPPGTLPLAAPSGTASASGVPLPGTPTLSSPTSRAARDTSPAANSDKLPPGAPEARDGASPGQNAGLSPQAFAARHAGRFSSSVPLAVSASPLDLLAGGAPTALIGAFAARGLAQPLAAAHDKPPILARPEMGQITLVAPPMLVASEQAEQGGLATAFDWTNLARGAGALDAGGLARLKQALPPGAQAIYPALPPGSLSAGAVNLALAPSLLGPLLHRGYGAGAAGMADKVGGMASAALGGSPTAAPLVARIVPGRTPTGGGPGLGHDQAHRQAGPAGALGQAGQGSATRGGVLDFLGMPVRLAPSLSGKPELSDEVAVRGGAHAAPGPVVRPHQFAALRGGLFPGSGSITAEPDEHAWAKAAPHFGLRDARPTTLLAPDARAPLSRSPSSFATSLHPTAPPPAPGGPASSESAAHSLPSLNGLALATHAPGGASPAAHPVAGMPAPSGHFGGLGGSPSSSPGGGASSFAPPHLPLGAVSPSRFSPGMAPGAALSGLPSFGAPSSVRPPVIPGLALPSFGTTGGARGGQGTPWVSSSANIGRQPGGPSGLLGRAFSPGGTGGQSRSAPSGPTYRSTASGSGLLGSRPSLGVTAHSTAPGGQTLTASSLPTLSAPSLPGMTPLRLPSAGAAPGLGAFARSVPLAPAAPVLSLGQPPRLPLASSAMPSAPYAASVIVERAPQMPLAPPSPLAGRAARPEAETTMVIQRAETGMPAPARRGGGGAGAAREGNPGAANAEGGANEVNLLANEVWSLLKRRIAWEADRRGRW